MENIKTAIENYIPKEFLPGETLGDLTDSAHLVIGVVVHSIAILKPVTFREERCRIQAEALRQ